MNTKKKQRARSRPHPPKGPSHFTQQLMLHQYHWEDSSANAPAHSEEQRFPEISEEGQQHKQFFVTQASRNPKDSMVNPLLSSQRPQNSNQATAPFGHSEVRSPQGQPTTAFTQNSEVNHGSSQSPSVAQMSKLQQYQQFDERIMPKFKSNEKDIIAIGFSPRTKRRAFGKVKGSLASNSRIKKLSQPLSYLPESVDGRDGIKRQTGDWGQLASKKKKNFTVFNSRGEHTPQAPLRFSQQRVPAAAGNGKSIYQEFVEQNLKQASGGGYLNSGPSIEKWDNSQEQYQRIISQQSDFIMRNEDSVENIMHGPQKLLHQQVVVTEEGTQSSNLPTIPFDQPPQKMFGPPSLDEPSLQQMEESMPKPISQTEAHSIVHQSNKDGNLFNHIQDVVQRQPILVPPPPSRELHGKRKASQPLKIQEQRMPHTWQTRQSFDTTDDRRSPSSTKAGHSQKGKKSPYSEHPFSFTMKAKNDANKTPKLISHPLPFSLTNAKTTVQTPVHYHEILYISANKKGETPAVQFESSMIMKANPNDTIGTSTPLGDNYQSFINSRVDTNKQTIEEKSKPSAPATLIAEHPAELTQAEMDSNFKKLNKKRRQIYAELNQRSVLNQNANHMRSVLNRTEKPGSIWGLDSFPAGFNLRGMTGGSDYGTTAQENYENLLRIHEQVQNYQRSQSKIKSLLQDRSLKKPKFLSKTDVGKMPDSQVVSKRVYNHPDFERDLEFQRTKSREKSRGSRRSKAGSRGGSKRRAKRMQDIPDSVEEARQSIQENQNLNMFNLADNVSAGYSRLSPHSREPPKSNASQRRSPRPIDSVPSQRSRGEYSQRSKGRLVHPQHQQMLTTDSNSDERNQQAGPIQVDLPSQQEDQIDDRLTNQLNKSHMMMINEDGSGSGRVTESKGTRAISFRQNIGETGSNMVTSELTVMRKGQEPHLLEMVQKRQEITSMDQRLDSHPSEDLRGEASKSMSVHGKKRHTTFNIQFQPEAVRGHTPKTGTRKRKSYHQGISPKTQQQPSIDAKRRLSKKITTSNIYSHPSQRSHKSSKRSHRKGKDSHFRAVSGLEMQLRMSPDAVQMEFLSPQGQVKQVKFPSLNSRDGGDRRSNSGSRKGAYLERMMESNSKKMLKQISKGASPKKSSKVLADKQVTSRNPDKVAMHDRNVFLCGGGYSQDGRHSNGIYKINQDNFVFHPGWQNQASEHLFLICDGHGTNGRQSSLYAAKKFKEILALLIQAGREKMAEQNSFSRKVSSKAIIPQASGEHGFEEPKIKLSHQLQQMVLKDSMFKAFNKTNQEVIQNRLFKVEASGTTLSSVLLFGNQLFVANVGDSRAILVSQIPQRPAHLNQDSAADLGPLSEEEPITVVKDLTVDHRLDNPEEEKRVASRGGITARVHGQGPKRLFNKKMTAPGLAISRTIGDSYAHTLGCSSRPDQFHKVLSSEDKVLVLATDGVWEHMTSQEVAEIAISFYDDTLTEDILKQEAKTKAQQIRELRNRLASRSRSPSPTRGAIKLISDEDAQKEQKKVLQQLKSQVEFKNKAELAAQAIVERAIKAWEEGGHSGHDDITALVIFIKES